MKIKAGLCILIFMLAACSTSSGRSSRGVDNDNSPGHASAKVHTELAGMYYERTQLGTALGEIDLALQADRNYAPAYNVRGLIHMALHEDDLAEEDFLHSLQLDESDPQAQNNYGWFLCQRGNAKESIEHFLAALKDPLYQTPDRAYLNAGLCSQKAGNNAAAEEYLQNALQLQPDLPQALLGLAQLKFAAGDYAGAKKYFNRFSEKNDNLTAEQLWLAVRIERKAGDRNSAASYGLQLRNHYPDARETQLLLQGE